nr:F [Calliteara abietis nucleopolyhedrovirus] [Calliteara abietis nucleopolyhedrovirus]
MLPASAAATAAATTTTTIKIIVLMLALPLLVVGGGVAATAILNSDEIVDVQPLPHTSGFYYQPVSKMQFVENLWTFVIEMDHSVIFVELDALYTEAEKFVNFINSQPSLGDCSTKKIVETELNTFVLKQILMLVQKHNDIDSKIPKAGEYDDHQPLQIRRRGGRQKRGALNFVGTIYKYLFGVMDHNDANLVHKLANSSNALNMQVKKITDELISLASYAEHTNCVEKHKIDACVYIEAKMNLMKSQIDEINLLYTNLDRAVDEALIHKVTSLVMTPKRLLAEMMNVSTYLPPKTSWPVALEPNNMHTLINGGILKNQVFITKERKLLFILQLPLVGQQMYNVYQVVPIPFCVIKNKCAVIVPDSKYLAVSSNRHNYARLDDDDTTKVCKQSISNLLCYKPKIIHDANQAKLCDIKILLDNSATDAESVEKNCDVRVGKFDPQIFHPISYYNNWLYVVQEDTRVDFDCSNADVNVAHVVLKAGVGIITGKHLNFTCKMVTSKLEMTIVQTFANNLRSTVAALPITTSFNLSSTLIDLDKFELSNFKFNNDLDHKNLDGMTERLIDLRKQMDNNTVFTADDFRRDDDDSDSWFCWFVSFFSISCHVAESIIASVVLIIVLLICYRIYRCMCPGLCSAVCGGLCSAQTLCACCKRNAATVVRVNDSLHYVNNGNSNGRNKKLPFLKKSTFPTVEYHRRNDGNVDGAANGNNNDDEFEQVFIKKY